MTRVPSLDRLLLLHSIAALFLVALSATAAGGVVYFQHQASRQAVSQASVFNALQGLRGDLYRQVKEVYDHVFVGEDARPAFLVLTAFGDIEDAVAAMKLGASDYLKKPIDLEELTVAIEKVSRMEGLRRRLDLARARESHQLDDAMLVGDSPALQQVRAQINTIAAASTIAEPPPTILILGETGTGKDLAARGLHARGSVANGPFVQVDRAALPKELFEAELFGHARGAYTGAQSARAGLIEAAEAGTVFLDEIAELPAQLQAKLLSVIERRRVRRIGSTREIEVKSRIIAATNRDLPRMVADRQFREDLYYRLNAVTLRMPPLRECREDIPRLAAHICQQAARRFGRPPPSISTSALQRLANYDWPGNVRELRNMVERAIVMGGSPELNVGDFPLHPPPDSATRKDDLAGLTLEQAERLLIAQALERAAGNISGAARHLGVSRMVLRYRIEKHGLEVPRPGMGSPPHLG